MNEDPYVYPDVPGVLKNKLGIKDHAELDEVERLLVAQRVKEGPPRGKFDLEHLCAIHKHLFQDVYVWAGKVRTVEIARGSHQFLFASRIPTGMADIHNRLRQLKFLKSASAADFARDAAAIIGDLNYVHPFREGNGRTQLQYLKLLAEHAGHKLDLSRLQRDEWIAASKAAHTAAYEPMRKAIAKALTKPSRDKRRLQKSNGVQPRRK